jgi:Fe-Mn family superoxide dismutase
MKNSKNLPWTIDEASIKEVIRESLNPGKSQKKEVANLAEAYVVSASKYDISTEKLSEENKSAHQELMQSYAKSLNEVSAALDTADRENANPNNSTFRDLKMNETYNINAAFLHGMFFENISDLRSNIAMDSLAYMRLERDWGTFEAWQRDFIACALSSRNGWVVTTYNFFLKRYMNVVVDLHNIGIPFASMPIIVIDCWEHSYYRDYLRDRKSYIFAMMKELKWETIEDRIRRAERMLEATK